MTRYARQTCLPEVGEVGQARLAAGRVLVAGAGGLGASLLPLLAGAGIGLIRLYDPDRVEESNLHRQTLFRMDDIGRPKALVTAETLRGLNPDCHVSTVVSRLDPLTARSEIPQVDIVIDSADNFAVSYALSDLCLATGTPLISASVLARRGYAGGFCGGAPSLRAVFPDLPGQMQNCATGGVMGPAVATLGALQAQMALSVLLGHDPSPLGQILNLDLASWHLSGFRFDGAPEPARATPEVISGAELSAADLVVDLRSDNGAEVSPDPDQRVVFVCNTGLRAWRAAKWLSASGHDRVAIVGDGR
ncbi:HesA/MoeB/ThiF family protein [Thalassovita mangrovi]|uniref:HesA/MoeB/ThiF family protein n=1 Tax=Thalassovita mangrovi TaxID=2692236 RepID=A0A6L8LQN0_9RHOB|nr:HesA/MoeB/ThiF family protein [Thalassovita mangrovi]MYM55822.1 HesA/MoeB/ThiF family protein [Thalassovita mangrovi]